MKTIKDEAGIEHAIIDRGNGEFTSMLKSTYDELKANEAKTIDEPATKSK